MYRKALLFLIIFSFFSGNIFSQENKYDKYEMLIGVGVGLGLTPDLLIDFYRELISYDDYYVYPNRNSAFYFEFGLNVDFYLTNYISINTGFTFRPETIRFKSGPEYVFPVYVNIPYSVHLNVPNAETLYIGIGVSRYIPVNIIYNNLKQFIGIPVDIGFDFIKSKRGGRRLLFRMTPEFHEKAVLIPFGIYFQTYNWRVASFNPEQ